jgi:hypothetical protein
VAQYKRGGVSRKIVHACYGECAWPNDRHVALPCERWTAAGYSMAPVPNRTTGQAAEREV